MNHQRRRPAFETLEATSVTLHVDGDTVTVLMIRNEGGSGISPFQMIAQACRAAGLRPRVLRGTRILRMQRQLSSHPPGTRLTPAEIDEMPAPRFVAQALEARVRGGTVIEDPMAPSGASSRSLELELEY
jgi:hypothetical protein